MQPALTALHGLVDHKPTYYERQLVHEATGEIPWIAQMVLYVIGKEVGYSAGEQNRVKSSVTAQTYYVAIEYLKALMKGKDEGPEGGVHNAAYEAVAKKVGMTVGALKQTLTRHAPRGKGRRRLKALAQEAARKKLGKEFTGRQL